MSVAVMDGYRPHRSGIYVPSSASEAPTEPVPAAPVPAPPVFAAAVGGVSEQPEPVGTDPVLPDGRTERVRALETEVAEREELAALQTQRAETHVESAKTLALRQSSADAQDRRRELANPARVALRDQRTQFVVNLVGFMAALLGLGWSTANVHATAAIGTEPGSLGWWLAWGVEPLISAALLTVMGAIAYLATRQVTIRDRWVRAAQWVPLGYTVTLNSWSSLPDWLIADPVMELLRGLIVHSVGPAVVVLLVHALPVLWAAFISLHTQPLADPPQSGLPNQSEQPQPPIDLDRARELLAIVRPAHQAGEVTTGVAAIRRYLATRGHRVGAPMGMWIRDALKQEVSP